MKNILFASDIDNTLLYSAKKLPEGVEGICAEYLEGKPQGFLSAKTVALLKEAATKTCFVTITTRSALQYNRIAWSSEYAPKFAIVANGAILLKDGKEDETWKRETVEAVEPYKPELLRLYNQLSKSSSFDICRIVDDAYLFALSVDEETAEKQAVFCKKITNLEVGSIGRKIYFFPPIISKGVALKRLKKLLNPKYVISAGDSFSDLPMLMEADCVLAPNVNLLKHLPNKNALCCENGRLFSEWLLKQVLYMAENDFDTK